MKSKKLRKSALVLAGVIALSLMATACAGSTQDPTDSSGSTSEVTSTSGNGTETGSTPDGTTQSGDATTSTGDSVSQGTASVPSGNSSTSSKDNKYGLPEINVKNKTVRLYTGPEKKEEDYKSKSDLPGAWEIAKEVYGVDIELVSCGDYNDWYSKLASLVLTDDAPDIAYPAAETFPYDIVKNNIIPLDDVIDFSLPIWNDVSSLLKEYSWNNVHYHAIINDGGQMQPVYYNPQMFRVNGVKTPKEYMEEGNWTWDTMLAVAQELTMDTDDNGSIDQWGIGGMFFTAMQESTGVRLVEVKGKEVKLNINDPAFSKAAQYIYDLGPKGKYKVATAFSHDNADLFVQGKVAMDVGSTWRATETYLDLWKSGKIDLVPFPKMDKNSKHYSGGVPGSLVIYRGSKNLDGAKAFIYSAKYCSSEQYKEFFKDEIAKQKPREYLLDLGLTDEQRETVNSIYDNDYPVNPNTWIGWLDNGYDCGLGYAHERQWSTILNLYTNKFTNNIETFKETLEIYTES